MNKKVNVKKRGKGKKGCIYELTRVKKRTQGHSNNSYQTYKSKIFNEFITKMYIMTILCSHDKLCCNIKKNMEKKERIFVCVYVLYRLYEKKKVYI